MEDEGARQEPEVLVTLQMRFPNLDPKALGELLAPVATEALKIGGKSFSFGIQPYDPDEGD